MSKDFLSSAHAHMFVLLYLLMKEPAFLYAYCQLYLQQYLCYRLYVQYALIAKYTS